MTSMKRRVLIVLTLLLLCIARYLLTNGHFFLPLPAHANFANEKLETRELHPFVIPLNTGIWWQVTCPGQSHLVDALHEVKPGDPHPTQTVFEKLGYPFPPGCSVIAGGYTGRFEITHYPSMLDRIQKDFGLKMLYRVPPDTEKPSSAK